MKDKILSLIREIEKEEGRAVQISLGEQAEVGRMPLDLFFEPLMSLTGGKIYGSLSERSCEVILINKDDEFIVDDLNHFTGRKYANVSELNEEFKKIPVITSYCEIGVVHPKLLDHFIARYNVTPCDVNLPHGGQMEWHSINDLPIDFRDFRKERPDIYDDGVNLLKDNNLDFLHHHLKARVSGIYVSEILYGEGEGEIAGDINRFDIEYVDRKIADIKFDFL